MIEIIKNNSSHATVRSNFTSFIMIADTGITIDEVNYTVL